MPLPPDATLAENIACEIAGLTPQKRRDWVKRGLLDQPKASAKLSESDVIEIAVVRELHDRLRPRDAAVVWKELRQKLPDPLPSGRLDVVVDLAYREVSLIEQDEDLAEAVRTGRPMCVIAIDDLVERVRAAVRRLA